MALLDCAAFVEELRNPETVKLNIWAI